MTDRPKCPRCGAMVYEDPDRYGLRLVCIAGHTVADAAPVVPFRRRPLMAWERR